MADRKIQSTNNYSLFQRSSENRPADIEKRKALYESMKQYGFVPEFPIIVYPPELGKMKIKDGQHRFGVASSLGLPIYYVVLESDFDVAVVNNAQRPWTINDYAHKWAKQNKESYVEAIAFADLHDLSVGTAVALLAGTTSYGNVQNEFRNGEFRIRDPEWANAVAAMYSPSAKASKAVRNSRFIEACMAVCRVKGFDPARFLKAMNRCREKLVAYSTKDAYLSMIEDIYNFGSRTMVPLKVEALNAMKSRSPVGKKRRGKQEPAAAPHQPAL